MDTHVGERHRETRDVKALYEIGKGKLPVIGVDEDTSVSFTWKNGVLSGEVIGEGSVHIFQTPEMPKPKINRDIMSKLINDPSGEEAHMWELKKGDVFEVLRNEK